MKIPRREINTKLRLFNVCLNFKSKIYGNQNLFQRQGSLQDRRWVQKGRDFPVQNEKALFLQCHKVAFAVKLIYETGFWNDVMDSVELDDVKLRYIERLSKKSKNGDFSNFACNEINNLQASKSQI